ncbi:p21-activated protein kinase, putative [Ichthyophthirius multifiliis]|uniref:P21-activated protein kinase, putative n=1 Tax=Ichthyophthirius multifiliis TaxID=5932 RepID=G0QZ19_ICHMU|nr:p21-activated protein kinase, putative [Ichthyophthirius multifiliis]EGR29536.1 p21-activated protein kinase, putative [Ichthyophthirius multifiliis]|eukprot:XP_004030772.1 p21-activated protein kinase, putative [Ichthyophthirius multifiliis]
MGNKHSQEEEDQNNENDISLTPSKPKNVKKMISITINENGQYEGFPEEWVNKLGLYQIDKSKTVNTKDMPEEVRATDLPESIISLINDKKMVISKPMNVKHQVHIQIDQNAPYGLKGLPEEWLELFKAQNIDQNEIKQNPQDMLCIIKGYEQEFIPKRLVLPTHENFIKLVESLNYIEEDPSKFYNFENQLGRGAMCKVYRAFRRKSKGEEFAIRVMKLSDDQTLCRTKIEMALMIMCQHNNIVKYIETYKYMGCLLWLLNI